jgi:hypothetical protein
VDVSFGTIWEAVARELPAAVALSEPGRDYTYAEFKVGAVPVNANYRYTGDERREGAPSRG